MNDQRTSGHLAKNALASWGTAAFLTSWSAFLLVALDLFPKGVGGVFFVIPVMVVNHVLRAVIGPVLTETYPLVGLTCGSVLHATTFTIALVIVDKVAVLASAGPFLRSVLLPGLLFLIYIAFLFLLFPFEYP